MPFPHGSPAWRAQIILASSLRMARADSNSGNSRHIASIYDHVFSRFEGACYAIGATVPELAIEAESAENEIRFLRVDYMLRHAVD